MNTLPDHPLDGRRGPQPQDEQDQGPRANNTREAIDQIDLADNDSDEFGWPYALMLGTDPARGWSLECDMEQGRLTAALTPAGPDAMLLISAEQPESGDSRYDHTTTATISIEGAQAAWDPDKSALTVWNGEAAPADVEARERLNKAAPEMLAALRECAEWLGEEPVSEFPSSHDARVRALIRTVRAAIAKAEGR